MLKKKATLEKFYQVKCNFSLFYEATDVYVLIPMVMQFKENWNVTICALSYIPVFKIQNLQLQTVNL